MKVYAIAAAMLAAPLGTFAPTLVLSARALADDAAVSDPYPGDRGAIAEGRQLYRSRCTTCHRRATDRGPSPFPAELSDTQFLETVLNGRGLMPPWKGKLSTDDVWKIRAFLKSMERRVD